MLALQPVLLPVVRHEGRRCGPCLLNPVGHDGFIGTSVGVCHVCLNVQIWAEDRAGSSDHAGANHETVGAGQEDVKNRVGVLENSVDREHHGDVQSLGDAGRAEPKVEDVIVKMENVRMVLPDDPLDALLVRGSEGEVHPRKAQSERRLGDPQARQAIDLHSINDLVSGSVVVKVCRDDRHGVSSPHELSSQCTRLS